MIGYNFQENWENYILDEEAADNLRFNEKEQAGKV